MDTRDVIKTWTHERVLVETPGKDRGRPVHWVWFIEEDGALSMGHMSGIEMERVYGPWTGAGGM